MKSRFKMTPLSELREMTVDELRYAFNRESGVSRNHLDRAAFMQHKILEKWYTLCEEAAALMHDEKARLERVMAKADLRCRLNYPDLKEGAVKSKVTLHKSVQLAKKEVRNATHRWMVCKGFVESCRHRKSMIRDLEQLYVAKYWDKAQ